MLTYLYSGDGIKSRHCERGSCCSSLPKFVYCLLFVRFLVVVVLFFVRLKIYGSV